MVWVRERTIPTERPLSAKWLPTFADKGCHVVSVTDPYGRILDFLDRSRYFFFQVAPQLCSRSWVDPVPDPLLLRKRGSAGNRTRTCGSAGRNSDHETTEVVLVFFLHISSSGKKYVKKIIKMWRSKSDRDLSYHWSTAIKTFLHPWPQTSHKCCCDTRNLVSSQRSLRLEQWTQLRNFRSCPNEPPRSRFIDWWITMMADRQAACWRSNKNRNIQDWLTPNQRNTNKQTKP
jgi:hypothetical protein